MNKVLNSFLEEYFAGLRLAPGLGDAWKTSLRFDSYSSSIHQFEPHDHEQSFHRIVELFQRVFSEQDQVLLVTDVHSSNNDSYLNRKPLSVYLTYIQHRKLLYKMRHYLSPSFVNKENETMKHRFIIPCRVSDLRYMPLIKSILANNFVKTPSILEGEGKSGFEVYFINHTQKIIFHILDGGCCDILAYDKEKLYSLFNECNQEVLEKSRKNIDFLFNK